MVAIRRMLKLESMKCIKSQKRFHLHILYLFTVLIANMSSSIMLQIFIRDGTAPVGGQKKKRISVLVSGVILFPEPLRYSSITTARLFIFWYFNFIFKIQFFFLWQFLLNHILSSGFGSVGEGTHSHNEQNHSRVLG